MWVRNEAGPQLNETSTSPQNQETPRHSYYYNTATIKGTHHTHLHVNALVHQTKEQTQEKSWLKTACTQKHFYHTKMKVTTATSSIPVHKMTGHGHFRKKPNSKPVAALQSKQVLEVQLKFNLVAMKHPVDVSRKFEDTSCVVL